MPDTLPLQKAVLIELKPNMLETAPGGKVVQVQFNPDSLKVSFANQVTQPQGGGSQKGTAGMLFVGVGSTKLSFQLWFDVARSGSDAGGTADVRRLTSQVAYFMTPGSKSDKDQYLPHPVRFKWGTFGFDGIIESIEETLDYWSPDGRPLRASLAVSMTQQKIDALASANRGATASSVSLLVTSREGATAGRPVGTTPMVPAPSGSSVPGLADAAGSRLPWQAIAAANGIENPRLLDPGSLLNLHPVVDSARFTVPLRPDPVPAATVRTPSLQPRNLAP